MKINKFFAAGVTSAVLLSTPVYAVTMTPVDLELALLIDVSSSVSATEFDLQLNGYVDAFNSNAVQSAISSGSIGAIAATVVFWAGSASQSQSLGWTLIDSAASSSVFATAMSTLARPFGGSTEPDDAIDFIVSGAGADTFASNAFNGTRNVIDVSGDGSGNSVTTVAARDAALAAGVDTINGIAIGGSASVASFYQDSIIGGTDSFFVSAETFGDFDEAIQRKLVAEITDPNGPTNPNVVPLPAAGWMLLAGLGGLAAMRRRQRSDKV